MILAQALLLNPRDPSENIRRTFRLHPQGFRITEIAQTFSRAQYATIRESVERDPGFCYWVIPWQTIPYRAGGPW